MGPLVDRTIESLKAAHRAAESEGVGKTAYRFKAPYGAEQLMSVAAIRVRGH